MHILHIKLHFSAYFHCIFFAYSSSTTTVYIIAYFLHISCISLAYTCIFKANNCILFKHISGIFHAYLMHI